MWFDARWMEIAVERKRINGIPKIGHLEIQKEI